MKNHRGELTAYRLRPEVVTVAIRTGWNNFVDLDMSVDQAKEFSREESRRE